MLRQAELQNIQAFIAGQTAFTVIAHIAPDGDTLGSSLALLCLLRGLHKQAEVVCAEPVPQVYACLPFAGGVKLPRDAAAYPAVISVDCADMARMGDALALFQKAAVTCNIDHHPTNDAYAAYNAVDASAAATGELIYSLARAVGVAVSADMANCLYAALMTDTGCFAYSNTTPDTLRIAGELLACGANGYDLNLRMFRSMPYAKLRLLGVAIANCRLYCDGQLGITTLRCEEVLSCGAREEDREGIVDHVRDIDTVEIAVFLRESEGEPNTYTVSLRSKHWADVGGMAARRGGGGHARAAGYTSRGSFEEVYGDALAGAKEILNWKES
ncbi:MAG: DHH family phosphoesterase [Christensenellaceae bacterium]|jgi:phosphoesterase RecJ-like protein|nr:DHH family phosphoesterase [Christensenellaceae bacterium]